MNQPPQPKKPVYHYVGEDLYLISFLTEAPFVVLVRYRHGLDGAGQVVDYDDLPGWVQLSLYKKIQEQLNQPSS